MKSAKRGSVTSQVEVVHVSARGFWIFFHSTRREFFVPFRLFPWFEDATIRELTDIEVERGHILRWPALDVDLDIERIEHPERYPLVAQRAPASQRKRGARAVSPRRAHRAG